MSKAEIISEIPKLSHRERREIMQAIFEAEQDTETLAECDRLALERFQMLDAMEAQDEKKILPGEIWRVDLGLVAKVRPALVMSDYPSDQELALLIIIPHTTAVRGSRWELDIPKPFLNRGVFHLQQIQPVSLARFDAQLGVLTADELDLVRESLIRLLHLQP